MVYPLIVGAKGFLGSHFLRFFKKKALATHKVAEGALFELDLCFPHLSFPTEGVNYALITAGNAFPKKCEEDPIGSYLCNVSGTLQLGDLCLERGITPVFFSSDYAVSALNAYGRQKKELEIEALKRDSLVIRLSKVYGTEVGDGSLFDGMAKQLAASQMVKAAEDQVGAPIWVHDVIFGVVSLMKQKKRGLFNFAGPVSASRWEIAHYLAEKLNFDTSFVQKISMEELNEGLVRPKDTTIKSDIPAISWKRGVTIYADNRKRALATNR